MIKYHRHSHERSPLCPLIHNPIFITVSSQTFTLSFAECRTAPLPIPSGRQSGTATCFISVWKEKAYFTPVKNAIRSGEERYPIKQGQGFLIHPGKLTFYQADSVNPWSYLWVGIGGHDAEKYLRLAGLSVRHPIFSCTQIDTAKSYILDMMKHHALSASNEIYIQGLLMQFLALLVEDAGCTVSPQQNTSSVYINQAISYIHKNYQNPLTVQEIADYLSLNRSYLTELFLKTVQLSPQQFLTRYRITKSEELLQSSSLSIQNIACSCGYSNSFSFSKAFRKVNGLSPSEYHPAEVAYTPLRFFYLSFAFSR